LFIINKVRVVVTFLCLVSCAIRAFIFQALSSILIEVVLDVLSVIVIIAAIHVFKINRLLNGSLIGTCLEFVASFFLIVLRVQILSDCLLVLLMTLKVGIDALVLVNWLWCWLIKTSIFIFTASVVVFGENRIGNRSHATLQSR